MTVTELTYKFSGNEQPQMILYNDKYNNKN